MASLTPIEDDPFATPQKGALTPVDHDPFASAPTIAGAGPVSPALPPGERATSAHAYVPGQIGGVQIPGLATLDNATRVAQDAMTFGGADALSGGTARADTAAARENLGPIASGAADIAGYAAGPGELTAGTSLARLLGGSVLARAAGGAAEGGVGAALGTVGHGDTDPADIAKAGGVGLGVGALTGMLPLPRELPHSSSTADLQNDATSAWRGPSGMPVAPNDVGNALAQVHLNLTPGERVLMGGKLNGKINDAMREATSTNSLSADDVNKFQSAIMDAARSPKEQRVAGKFSDALEGTYGQSQPAIDAARTATSRAKTSDELDQLIADPKSAPQAVTGMLAKNPGLYAHIQEALQPIADMANPTLGQTIKDRILQHGLGAIGGAAAGAIGGPIGIGAALGAIRSPVTGAVTTAVRQKPIISALKAARHMNATGDMLPPSAFSIPSRGVTIPSALLRQSGYAAGATGVY